MRRYQYGQNCQTFNNGKITTLVPVGMLEVAPGETVTGKFTVKAWSDTTTRPIMNRMYYDTFAFYVPFRLLWDQWTEFIADQDSGLIPPVIASPYNQLLFEDNAGNSPNALAWNRRAYTLIWNKFFRDTYQDEIPVDSDFGLALSASQRPTTFHESCFDGSTIEDTDVTVDVVNESISLNDLRRGFAEDRFRKIRSYYGEKYTEYLASLGVKASWSITDEPELIGKASKDWMYRQTNSTISSNETPTTPEQSVGDPAGQWEGGHATRIRPTFCPEHGIIMMLGVARMETPNDFGNCPPWLGKFNWDEYYNPQTDDQLIETYDSTLWSADLINQQPGDLPQGPRYNEYRKASNLIGRFVPGGDPTRYYYFANTNGQQTPSDYRQRTPAEYDPIFTGNLGGGNTEVHYCVTGETRMKKLSPVKPFQSTSVR